MAQFFPVPAWLPRMAFVLGMAVYVSVRINFKRKAAAGAKSVDKSTVLDKALVALVAVGQMAVPLLFLATPWLGLADRRMPAAATWLGAGAMVAGVWLFWRSHADLGDNWSVTLELNDAHQLITQGVYRLIRHPMYASFFVMGVGQALLLANWIAGVAGLAAVALLYVARKPREEAMMLTHFGEEYERYMRRTGGVIPRLHSQRKL